MRDSQNNLVVRLNDNEIKCLRDLVKEAKRSKGAVYINKSTREFLENIVNESPEPPKVVLKDNVTVGWKYPDGTFVPIHVKTE